MTNPLVGFTYGDKTPIEDFVIEDIDKLGYQMRNIQPGVTIMDGHDKGVPYKFFRLVEKDAMKSKAAGFAVHRSEDCVMWLKNKRMKCTERVRFLPPELLNIDHEGNITGVYAEAYKRYLKGQTASGLELSKWGKLDDASIADLTAMNIFSVEQFASMPKDRFARMGDLIKAAHEDAILWVRGQEGRFEAEKNAERIVGLESELVKNQDLIAKLEEKLNLLSTKKSRKKKEQYEENISTLDNLIA